MVGTCCTKSGRFHVDVPSRGVEPGPFPFLLGVFLEIDTWLMVISGQTDMFA